MNTKQRSVTFSSWKPSTQIVTEDKKEPISGLINVIVGDNIPKPEKPKKKQEKTFHPTLVEQQEYVSIYPSLDE